MFFLSALGSEDGGKKGTKTSRNGGQDGPKSIPEESSKKKRGKYGNEQQSFVLAQFWVSTGIENRRKNEKGVAKTIQNQRVISKRLFYGFLSIWGPFGNPRSTQNRRKRKSNTRPIFNRSCKVVQPRSSLGHGRPDPPGRLTIRAR